MINYWGKEKELGEEGSNIPFTLTQLKQFCINHVRFKS